MQVCAAMALAASRVIALVQALWGPSVMWSRRRRVRVRRVSTVEFARRQPHRPTRATVVRLVMWAAIVRRTWMSVCRHHVVTVALVRTASFLFRVHATALALAVLRARRPLTSVPRHRATTAQRVLMGLLRTPVPVQVVSRTRCAL